MSSEHLPHYEEDQDPGTALLGRTHAKMLAVIRSPYRIRDEPETIDLSSDTANGVKPSTRLLRPPIEYPKGDEPFTMRQHYRKLFIDEFYEAIDKGDTATIDLLITVFELKEDTIGAGGITPLLAAVQAGHISVVAQLLAFGADPNVFGTVLTDNLNWPFFERPAQRTPLMLAAAQGNLPIVHLLHEPPYSADDALVAPDGQIALRLAAAGGHTYVVAYLPAQRGGALRRCRVAQAANIARLRDSFKQFQMWIHFFLWTVPKYVLVRPGMRLCRWCWYTGRRFFWWCVGQIRELPGRVKRAGVAVYRSVKKIPKLAARAGKAIWRAAEKVPDVVVRVTKKAWTFGTETLPRLAKEMATWIWELLTHTLPKLGKEFVVALWNFFTNTLPRWGEECVVALWNLLMKTLPNAAKNLGVYLWRVITQTLPQWGHELGVWLWDILVVRIPHALRPALEWVWSGMKDLARDVWDIIGRTFSLLHTALEAAITFLRNVTLKDVWNAFCDLLRSVLITLPKTIWSWVGNFADVSKEILQYLLGRKFGFVIWAVSYMLIDVAFFIPRKLFVVLQSLARSFTLIIRELILLIDPKQ